MATFALVHGAWHGGWCWAPLAGLLRRGGHTVVAPDLPVDDLAAGVAEYAAVVEEALDQAAGDSGDVDVDVILVGHDIGGLVTPLVAEHRPVAGLIFLCAFLPEPGAPMPVDDDTFAPAWADLVARRETHDDGTTSWPADAAVEVFYHDCPRQVATSSAAQLRRQAPTPAEQPNPLKALPKVPAAYVLCTQDRSINPTWSHRVARTRLGVDAVELPGGHSPMLADPDLLADLLDQMAAGLAQIRSGPSGPRTGPASGPPSAPPD